MKKVLLIAAVSFMCLFVGNSLVYADDASVSDFIGEYIGDMPEVDKYANPDVMELYFNDSGNLERYSGLFYGTTGTTICYEYTGYEINGNVLTCQYTGAFSPYNGPRSDISGGVHEYTLQEDGNISSDGHIWYRYLTEEEKAQQEQSCILASANDTDFSEGKYSKKAEFLDIGGLKRSSIEEIQFLSTLEQKPDDARDVSQNQDGSVYAWLDSNNEVKKLYIAANGDIIANIDCENLFRLCSRVKKIDFNDCFDTSQTKSMKNMFADCEKLEEITGIDNWDTSSVTDMQGMFYKCKNLQSFDISALDTSNAYIFNKMFYKCSSLKDINIDFFPKGDAIEYDDIFTGTVREGDAPGLTMERNTRVIASYILDNEDVLADDNLLQAKVVNSYDDVLKNLDELTDNFSGTMYAIHDINGDKIPEMIMKRKVDDFYVYSAYTYNKKRNRVEGIEGIDFESSSNTLYYISENNTIIYMTRDGGYHVCIWKADQFVEDSVIDYSEFENMKDIREANFRYVYPELIWEASTEDKEDDSDEESEKEEADINYELNAYAEKNEAGYASIVLYVNDEKVFTQQADGKTQYADISGYTLSDGSIWLYIRMYSDTADDYCGILRYKNGQMKEMLSLEGAVNEMQLVTEQEHNYFDMNYISGYELSVTFHLTPIAYGEDFTFSMNYTYSDEGVKQQYYLTDIQNIFSNNYTLSKDKEIYAQIADTKVKYKAKGGTKLMPDKVWLCDGLIWLQINDNNGKNGWVPMSAESPYLENSYGPENNVKKKIEENRDNTIYFKDSAVPDKETLYNLAEANYEAENYEDAIIYYQFFHFLEPHYLDAKKKIMQAEKMMENGENSSEAEKSSEVNEEKEQETENVKIKEEKTNSNKNDNGKNNSKKKEVKKKARKELMKLLRSQNFDKEHPLAYAAVDLDQDGVKEIMTRSFNYLEDGMEQIPMYTYNIYQYDGKCVKYKHLSNATFDNYAGYDIYFWEDMGYLVVDSGGGLVNYTLYTLEDEKLVKGIDTSSDMSYLPKIEFEDLKLSTDKEKIQENLEKEKKNDYQSVVSSAESQYGVYTLTSMNNIQYAYGVCYLELRDLNNDGTDELFMVHNTDLKDNYGNIKLDSYEYEIWTMISGEAVLLETGHLYYSNGGWPSVRWAEYDGSTYLVTNYDNIDSCWFHGFKPDGSFGVVYEFLFEYTDTGYITSINGVETDRDSWIAKRDEYQANMTDICLYYEGADNVYPMVESVKNTLTGGNTEEPKETAVQTDTVSEGSFEYLLPEVASRYLNQSEVETFSADQLQLAINEIFARHGRCFKTEGIDAYFRSKSWYQPDASKTDDQIVAEFNEYEKANEELLEMVREEK